MPAGQPLEFLGVTKRFGAVTAVSGLTARVEPGRVTGFLGPNGAGKTTTLRILLGLVRATDGQATIGGRRYAELEKPLHTVGAVLEASSFHPGRTGAAHLTIYAQAGGIARSRVGEVLDLVGLTDAASRKVGGYSLGMRQRLGLAYALLGDPGVLVLDEPANGLDPEGIRWLRGFLRELAREGRTVLVSSHLLAEVQQTVDALLILSRGRLVFQGGADELGDSGEYATVVDAPDRAALATALRAAGVPFEVLRSGFTVRGVDPAAVGAAAAAAGVALSSLHRRGPALEEVFLDLVNGTRVHASAADAVAGTDAAPAGAPGAAAALGTAAGAPGAAAALGAAAGAASSGDAGEPEVPPAAEASEAGSPDADSAPAIEISAWEAEAPEDADPDVEAIGAIDDELMAPEPPDADDDRPWENYVKTDADVEADAFFASFDDRAGGGDPAGPTAEPGAAPEDAASVAPAHSEGGAGSDATPDPGHQEGGDR
jgi:ABC-2 type transport system ATP-binding protein